MAKRRKGVEETDDLDGTVEGLARDHWNREAAEYEKRTGQKVTFVPPVPTTRTPIPEESGEALDEILESQETPVEPEGEGEI